MRSCGMFCCTPLNKTGISGVQEWNIAGAEQEAGPLRLPHPALNLPLTQVHLSWIFFV